jgi:hypothetical protein
VAAHGSLGDPAADLVALDQEQAVNVSVVVAAVRAAVKHLMAAWALLLADRRSSPCRAPYHAIDAAAKPEDTS